MEDESDASTLLKDEALIAYAPGNPLAIKIFQQRNCVLACDADEVLKRNHIELWRLRLLRNNELS